MGLTAEFVRLVHSTTGVTIFRADRFNRMKVGKSDLLLPIFVRMKEGSHDVLRLFAEFVPVYLLEFVTLGTKVFTMMFESCSRNSFQVHTLVTFLLLTVVSLTMLSFSIPLCYLASCIDPCRIIGDML